MSLFVQSPRPWKWQSIRVCIVYRLEGTLRRRWQCARTVENITAVTRLWPKHRSPSLAVVLKPGNFSRFTYKLISPFSERWRDYVLSRWRYVLWFFTVWKRYFLKKTVVRTPPPLECPIVGMLFRKIVILKFMFYFFYRDGLIAFYILMYRFNHWHIRNMMKAHFQWTVSVPRFKFKLDHVAETSHVFGVIQ